MDESFFIENDMDSDDAELSMFSSLNLNSSTFTLAASTLSGGTTSRSHRAGASGSFKSAIPRPTTQPPAPAAAAAESPLPAAVPLQQIQIPVVSQPQYSPSAAPIAQGELNPQVQIQEPLMAECAPTPLLSLQSPMSETSPKAPTDDSRPHDNAPREAMTFGRLEEVARFPNLHAQHVEHPSTTTSSTLFTGHSSERSATIAPVRRRSIDDPNPSSTTGVHREGGHAQPLVQQVFLEAVVRFDQPQSRSPTNGSAQAQPSPLLMSSRKRSVVLYDPQEEVLGPLSAGGGTFSFDIPEHDSVEGTPTNSNTNPPSRDPLNEAPAAATSPIHQVFRSDRPALVLRVPSFTSVHRSVDCDASSPSCNDSSSQHHPAQASSLFRFVETTQSMLSPGGTPKTPKRTASTMFVDSLSGEPIHAAALHGQLGTLTKRVGSFSQASSRSSPQFLQLHHEVSPKQSYQYFITSSNDDALSSCSHAGGGAFEGSRRGIVLLTARTDALQGVPHRVGQSVPQAAQESDDGNKPTATPSPTAAQEGHRLGAKSPEAFEKLPFGDAAPFVVSSDRRSITFAHVKPADAMTDDNEATSTVDQNSPLSSDVAPVASAAVVMDEEHSLRPEPTLAPDQRNIVEAEAQLCTQSLLASQEAADRQRIASQSDVQHCLTMCEWLTLDCLHCVGRAYIEACSDVLYRSHGQFAAGALREHLHVAHVGHCFVCELGIRHMVVSSEATEMQQISVQWAVTSVSLRSAAWGRAVAAARDALTALYGVATGEARSRGELERRMRGTLVAATNTQRAVVATRLQQLVAKETAQRVLVAHSAMLLGDKHYLACRTWVHELFVRDCLVTDMDACLIMMYVASQEQLVRQHIVSSYVAAIETARRYHLRVQEARCIQVAAVVSAEGKLRAQLVAKRRVELQLFATNLYCADAVYPVEHRRRCDIEHEVLRVALPKLQRHFLQQYSMLAQEYHLRVRIEVVEWPSTRLVLLEEGKRRQLSLRWVWCMSAMCAAFQGAIHYLACVVPVWMRLGARSGFLSGGSTTIRGGNPRVVAMLSQNGTCFTDCWQYEHRASQAERRQRLLQLFLASQQDSLVFRRKSCKAQCAAGTRLSELKLYLRKQRIRNCASRHVASPIRHRYVAATATSNPLLCYGVENEDRDLASIASTSSAHNLAVGRIRKFQAASSRLKGRWPEDRYNEGRWHSVYRVLPRMEQNNNCQRLGYVKEPMERTSLWRRLAAHGGAALAVHAREARSCRTMFLRGATHRVRQWLFVQRHASTTARLMARRAGPYPMASTPARCGIGSLEQRTASPSICVVASPPTPRGPKALRAAVSVAAARKPILCLQAFARACCSRLEVRTRLQQLPSRYAVALRSLVSQYEYLEGYGQRLQSAVEGVLGTRCGDGDDGCGKRTVRHGAERTSNSCQQHSKVVRNSSASVHTVDAIYAASIYHRYDAHLVPERRRPFSAGTVRPSRGPLEQHSALRRNPTAVNVQGPALRSCPSDASQLSTSLMVESVSDALEHWAERCSTIKRQSARRTVHSVRR